MTATATSLHKVIELNSAQIRGVVSCVPSRAISNDFFIERFDEKSVNDITKMIGVQSRRWVDSNVTTADLCEQSGRHLLVDLGWSPESVDAIIFISQTPDYKLPATACILQHKLGLSSQTIAFDVNLGCSGYPYGLWLANTLVQSGSADRVLLAVGDTISKVLNPNDRSTAFLFGDAGTMTAIERSNDLPASRYILGTDGQGAKNLLIPKGICRADNKNDLDPRFEGKDVETLFMDGGEIFNFTLKAVPPLVLESTHRDGKAIECDFYLFHQANLFMLKHLIKKIKIPADKAPINIEEFGNTSSASIPLLMTTRIADQLKERSNTISMFGFGVGYSWASALMCMKPLQVVKNIIYEQ